MTEIETRAPSLARINNVKLRQKLLILSTCRLTVEKALRNKRVLNELQFFIIIYTKHFYINKYTPLHTHLVNFVFCRFSKYTFFFRI